MWIKTHEGNLVNINYCSSIEIVKEDNVYHIKAEVVDFGKIFTLATYNEEEDAKLAMKNIQGHINCGEPDMTMPTSEEMWGDD